MPAFMAISLALCTAAIAADYATTFATPEDPLSEGMVWQHATNIWKHVRIVGDGSAANPHRAVGHDNRAYDDAYAQLAGFAPDQLAEATIWIDPSIPAHEIHEVELHLRWTDSTGKAGAQESARGYELLLAYDGAYYAIVRWNGPYGRFTRLAVGYHLSPVPKTGDAIRGTAVGTTIRFYIDRHDGAGFVLLCAAIDTGSGGGPWRDGDPGIGFCQIGDNLQGPGGDRFGFTGFVASQTE